ncbi:MAG: mobile mystery protein B [Ignavibacteriales bacterium]|nr:mobile mystery protein B [Ignavibacteriales bacterium]
MGLDFDITNGQTPLEEDEREGLLVKSVTTRGELDEFEQLNIEKAVEWSIRRSLSRETLLSESFVKELHRRMYDEVWRWAGEFRKTNKNIGVDKQEIGIELRKLLDDTAFWLDNITFPADEIAVRFSHRVVSIHCFSNGNGRHSRLMADILVSHLLDRPVFTWGSANLVKQGDPRSVYLSAIREADGGTIAPLVAFARS